MWLLPCFTTHIFISLKSGQILKLMVSSAIHEISSLVVHKRVLSLKTTVKQSKINHRFDEIKRLGISRSRWRKRGSMIFCLLLGPGCTSLQTHAPPQPRHGAWMFSHLLLTWGQPDSHVTPLQPPSALGTEKRVALYKPPEGVNWSACGTVRAGGYRDTPPCVITNLAWVLNVPVSPYPARRKHSTFSSNLLFTAMFHYKVKIFTEKKKGLKIGTHN